DGDGFLLVALEELHAEQLEGGGRGRRDEGASESRSDRERGASPQKRKTLVRPVHDIPHPLLSVAFLLRCGRARQAGMLPSRIPVSRLMRGSGWKDPTALGFP